MFSRVRKFTLLNRAHKIAFVEAYVLLGLMRLAILTLPFKWLTRSLSQCAESDLVTVPFDLSQQPLLSIVSCSIRQAAAHTPWESVCLPQALTAYRMLKRRGVSGQLFLGIRKDDDSHDPFEAHAWSSVGGLIVTGGHGYETFTVISVFTWKAL